MQKVNEKRTEVVIKQVVAAGSRGVLNYRIPSDCTIELIRVNFYPGQERCLRLTPVAKHGQRFENFIELVGEPYLSGDDDYLSYDVSVPMAYDDEILLYYENIGSWPYTVDTQFTLEYENGQRRAD